MLVREGSRARLEELISRWEAEQGRIVPVIGDLTAPALGVSDADRKTAAGVDHFFHLAAVYDMSADEETNRRANVDGTRHAVELANELRAKRFHHTSSIAVSGRYRGLFREDMFDEGQKFDDPYSRTKFESEKLVRDEANVPWRVYRPGDRRGSLRDRRDGQDRRPLLLLQGDPAAARACCRRWMPVVGLEGGKINIVPVDFVASAMDHIAHQPTASTGAPST